MVSWERNIHNNEISLADARKMLSSKELAELKWDVNQYIKAGKENAVSQKWMKELENASARFHISRLQALQYQIQNECETTYAVFNSKMKDYLTHAVEEEFYKTVFEIQKGFGVGYNLSKIDKNRIRKILEKPWAPDESIFSDRIWKNKKQLIYDLNVQLSQSIITGKDPKKLIRVFSQKFSASKSNAGRLIMTERAAFDTIAQQEAFKELDVEEYKIIATLDSHTSEICQEMDGQHFKVSEMEIGTNAPPFHPRCRTSIAPYIDFKHRRAVRGEDGKTYYISSDISYKEWKQKFVS